MLNVIKYTCNHAASPRSLLFGMVFMLLLPLCLGAADDVRKTVELTVAARPQSGGRTEGSGKYIPGTVVEITAVPSEGYLFSRWEGTVSNPRSPSTKTYVGADALWITAIFEPRRHMVEVTVVPSGAGTVEGAGYQPGGVAAPVYAQPATGYVFDKWEGPVSSAGSASTTLRAPLRGTVNLTAYFKPASVDYKVTVLADVGGTATGSGVYKRGTVVNLKATPTPNFVFAGWAGPVSRSGTLETTLYVTGDVTITAKFALRRSFLIRKVSPEGAGRIVAESGAKPVGVPIPVRAEASAGYVFVRWEGPAADRKNPVTTTTLDPDKRNELTAIFERRR
jgi:hypothetical protein